jgi:DNA polymerase (family 10)
MTNSDILDQITLYAQLLELHGENPFKIRSYHTAVFHLEKTDTELAKLSLTELEKLPNVGKAIAGKIEDAARNGIFRQLKDQLAQTPAGIVEMLGISGLGIKKIQTIWKELGIEDIDQLLQACENNQIAVVKGFGEKTQENIKQALLFKKSASDKAHFADAEALAQQLEQYLTEKLPKNTIQTVGQIRLRHEVVDKIQVVVAAEDIDTVFNVLDQADFLQKNIPETGMFAWRGRFQNPPLPVEIRVTAPERYANELFINSASSKHLGHLIENQTLYQLAQKENFASEAAIYEKANLPFIAPELREGLFEFALAQENTLPQLLEMTDLRGILHAHSTYSDGKHSLEVMANACKDLGYEYLGITDHSKSAFYANGLQEYKVMEQHAEIDRLNQSLAPFKIFKGIESDILSDGSLDYEADILRKFDFVIASVHSALKMTEEKATERLIKAIENPFTTILGHPTGRLLLRREGYPIHHTKVIEACAANGVVIEINASPWRLDLAWQWVHYALEKGVMLSINPDSHEKGTIQEAYYGVCVGRKGGLTTEMTLNTLSVGEIGSYFEKRKVIKY